MRRHSRPSKCCLSPGASTLGNPAGMFLVLPSSERGCEHLCASAPLAGSIRINRGTRSLGADGVVPFLAGTKMLREILTRDRSSTVEIVLLLEHQDPGCNYPETATRDLGLMERGGRSGWTR